MCSEENGCALLKPAHEERNTKKREKNQNEQQENEQQETHGDNGEVGATATML